jgi:hypothetical protein
MPMPRKRRAVSASRVGSHRPMERIMRKHLTLGIAVVAVIIGMLAAINEASAQKPVRICIPTLSGGRTCWISAG